MCPFCEAPRIAIDQSRLHITNVAFFHKATAQRAVLVHARHAVVNENEPNCPWNGVRPRSWTVSRGGFDSLPGVVILELCWA